MVSPYLKNKGSAVRFCLWPQMINKIKKKYQHGELFDYILWKTGISRLSKIFNSFILKIFDSLIKFVLFLNKTNSERYISIKYFYLKKRKSDIYEHLETLYRYATKCDSIFETGVRGVVSSWAFLKGLLDNKTSVKTFLLNDIEDCNTSEIEYHAQKVQIDLGTIWRNNLEINLNRKYDLIFIDTWHVYGQLKRELDKFSLHCNKYIIMHDTTLDGELGESLRYNMDTKEQSKHTGFTVDEIEKGLWPAVEEFLDNNDDWELEKRYENCNGLTILKKIQ
jgi:hypothetical protein